MLVILDHMSLVHAFVNSHNFNGTEDIENWVNFFSHPANYIPVTPLGSPFDFYPILVSDSKASQQYFGVGESEVELMYWRHKYFSGYKSKRKPATPILSAVRELTAKMWMEKGYTYLSRKGFEADDFAAYFHKHYSDVKKYYVTIDGDWSGLINSNSYWVDTYCSDSYKSPKKYRHNILDVTKMLDRFNNHKDYTRKFVLSQPSDIYEAKHILGDASDTIPGGRLVDKGIISLIDPLEEIPKFDLDLTKLNRGKPMPRFRCDMFGLPLLEWL